MQGFYDVKTDQLIGVFRDKSDRIIQNLDRESIDVFNFLKTEFGKGDVSKNHLFQFIFRSFYRLDNAGLTSEFKSRFFELMEENRNNKSIEIEYLLLDLEKYPRIKEIKKEQDKGSFQFSFVTKLINTIDPEFPIYDSKVSKAIIGTAYNPSGNFDQKLNIYQARHEVIRNTYSYILESKSFSDLFSHFDNSFPSNGLSDLKKLDFIFWSYGKLLG